MGFFEGILNRQDKFSSVAYKQANVQEKKVKKTEKNRVEQRKTKQNYLIMECSLFLKMALTKLMPKF